MRAVRKLRGEGRRILVVDDDLAIRVLLDAVLKRMDFTVMQASDGQKALDLLGRYDYDLILLDLMMPVIDGYEVLKRLDPRIKTPILVFTAAENSEESLNGRVCDSIRKPFDLELFIASVATCLGDALEAEDEASAAANSD